MGCMTSGQMRQTEMTQEGIDIAQDEDAVVVLNGVYWHPVSFGGNSIELVSFEPRVSGEKGGRNERYQIGSSIS